MRVVVWNCNNGNLDRKLDALTRLAPDIAVLPECPPGIENHGLLDTTPSSVWVGRPGERGLGVIGFNGFTVELDAAYDDRIQWVAPVHISGPQTFFLLAVWAFNQRAKNVHPDRPERWQTQQALDVYAPLLDGPIVVAGDFNHHVRWDKPAHPGNHATTVKLLDALGLVSAYHASRGVEQGDEPEPTMYWRNRTVDGPTYHIDYCFVPNTWTLTSVNVGSHADWVATKLSDHVPVVVDVRPAHGRLSERDLSRPAERGE